MIQHYFKKIKNKYHEYGIFVIAKYPYRYIRIIYVSVIRKFIKVDKHLIVFYSKPDFSDNSRALYKYLYEKGYTKIYDIRWIVDVPDKYCIEKSTIRFYKRYNRLKEKPIQTIILHLRAKYIFTTHLFYIPIEHKLKDQLYIDLWHGCGYKGQNHKENVKSFFDFLVVPGPIFVQSKARFWNTTEDKFLPIGYPRYDWLQQNDENAHKMFVNLKEECEKLVIWMPTFRNSQHSRFPEDEIKEYPLLTTIEKWKAVDECCHKNGVRLLIKLHTFQKEYDIDFSLFSNIIRIDNEDFEKNSTDLYHFLPYTDALISDYSSVAIDYLIVNKPIAFVLDDYDRYKTTRGFVFDNPQKYMPGHHLYNVNDLQSFLEDVVQGNDLYCKDREQIKAIAIHESKNYRKDLVCKLGL